MGPASACDRDDGVMTPADPCGQRRPHVGWQEANGPPPETAVVTTDGEASQWKGRHVSGEHQ